MYCKYVCMSFMAPTELLITLLLSFDVPGNTGSFLACFHPLSQDGMMVPYGMDETSKPRLEVTGTKYVFSIDAPQADDAGFYQVDVGEANVLSTDFRGNMQPVSIC